MCEIVGVLEERFATKTRLEAEVSKAKAAHALRATAPEFVPSPALEPSARGGTASHLQKPPPFDGRSP